ncbi:hypothetical protein Bbelb_278160 [Branchiostoma belcheri]|nr:hypothetical protein Bbelb_278160 [Branchiostoma belcheri]
MAVDGGDSIGKTCQPWTAESRKWVAEKVEVYLSALPVELSLTTRKTNLNNCLAMNRLRQLGMPRIGKLVDSLKVAGGTATQEPRCLILGKVGECLRDAASLFSQAKESKHSALKADLSLTNRVPKHAGQAGHCLCGREKCNEDDELCSTCEKACAVVECADDGNLSPTVPMLCS